MNGLDELRREHAEQVIGPQLAALLRRVVSATARTYPAAEYSASGVWDRAALDDTAQDWVLTRLLERRDLSVMLASARSLEAFRSMLTRSLRQHLTNRRRRTRATNLFSRVTRMLRGDDAFLEVGSTQRSGDQHWTLADDPSELSASAGTVEQLIKASFARSDAELGVVRYGPYSLKSSPVLRGPRLHEFLQFLLAEADGYLSTSEMFQVMRHRFNLFEPVPEDLDADLRDDATSVASAAELRIIARSILANLGSEDARLIRAMADSGNQPNVATHQVDASLGELAAAVDRLHSLIAEYATSGDEAIALHRLIIESLYGEDEIS